MVKVKDIVSRFEEFAPKWMAEDGDPVGDRKSTRLNSSHANESRMPSSA